MFENVDGWVIIASIGVLAWAAVIMTWSISGRSRKSDSDQLQAALDASTAADAKVAEQLAALDKRLAAIEKTLTDIG